MLLLNNLNKGLLLLQQKLEGIKDGQIAIDKTDYLKIIKGSFIGNQIRKKKDVKQFWGNIWSQSADHKKDAKWLQDLRSEVNVKKNRRRQILPYEV